MTEAKKVQYIKCQVCGVEIIKKLCNHKYCLPCGILEGRRKNKVAKERRKLAQSGVFS